MLTVSAFLSLFVIGRDEMRFTFALLLPATLLIVAIGLTGCSPGDSSGTPVSDGSETAEEKSKRMAELRAANPPIELGENEDLLEVIQKAPGVVLVDFYAGWCMPCRLQSAILQTAVATENKSKASIIKVDVEIHENLAEEHDVVKLPTLIVFKNGEIVERKTGVADKDEVAAMLNL